MYYQPVTYASAWGPPHYVGQIPGASQAAQAGVATADAYTYGGASAALSEGQALAAWADLSAKQNTPAIQSVAVSKTCPDGWLISPDGKTCVNMWNVHIALADKDRCSPNDPQWFACSALPLWFQLHHLIAFDKLSEAKKMLPTALRELGYLSPPFNWQNVKASIHALARYLNIGAGFSGGDGKVYGPGDYEDLTEEETENALVNTAAPIYDAAVAKGGDAPQWVSSNVLAPTPKTSWLTYALLAATASTLAWFLVPGFQSMSLSLLAKARPALHRIPYLSKVT
jgi:hypothetical protein